MICVNGLDASLSWRSVGTSCFLPLPLHQCHTCHLEWAAFRQGGAAMKRAGMMVAMAVAMLVSAGNTPATVQESVSPAPASPVEGGKVIKEKSKTTMTAVGAVKTVAADSLAISDASGKDWTFVIDATTKILPRTGKETVD